MQVKTLEERITERAQNELKIQIAQGVNRLRNMLGNDAAGECAHLYEVLAQVEVEIYKATQARFCNEKLDIALAELEQRLYPDHNYVQAAAAMPFVRNGQ